MASRTTSYRSWAREADQLASPIVSEATALTEISQLTTAPQGVKAAIKSANWQLMLLHSAEPDEYVRSTTPPFSAHDRRAWS